MDTETKLPEVKLSEIIQRVVNNEDQDRLKSFTSLLNTFNYAVQVQSGRTEWETTDFRLFSIALSAMDQIGMKENEETAMQLLQGRYAQK